MRGSDFVLDYVQLCYYKCHKINIIRGGWYIDSPDRIKNKEARINPINKKDNNCFQYAVTVALHYEEIKKDLQRIKTVKPFRHKYDWKRINYPSEKDDWKQFEKNHVIIVPNVLYTKEKIYVSKHKHAAYVSKRNPNREKQVILLIISNGEKQWHYLAFKKLLALLRGITAKYHCDFYCLNCFHYFSTTKKLQSHKRACENKDFRHIIMPSDDNKILEFDQYQKSDKALFIIILYAELACIAEKIDGCKNIPEKSSTTIVSEHIPSGFSMFTISSFQNIENKHDLYRGKDFMKKFREFLREHTAKIHNFKKVKLLTKERQESNENAKIWK